MNSFCLHQLVIGWKGRLDRSQATRSASDIAQMMAATAPTVGIALYLGGFDDTPAELYDIREARRFLIWVAEDLAKHRVDFSRLMPETRSLLEGCKARARGRPVVLHEQGLSDYIDELQAWGSTQTHKIN